MIVSTSVSNEIAETALSAVYVITDNIGILSIHRHEASGALCRFMRDCIEFYTFAISSPESVYGD